MRVSPNDRRGWSLLEMMVVIPLMTLVLSASALLLTAVMRSQGVLLADLQEQAARSRLAVQLRTDAHGARNARCDTPQVCDFLLEGGETIHYEVKESTLHRQRRQNEAVSEREAFPLTALSAAFSVDESEQRPLVRLRLEAVPDDRKYSRSAPPSILEAAVGIHTPPPARSSQP